MPKNKFYVVWHGKTPGIYTSWAACKVQVEGINGALYMGFPTSEHAEKAFNDEPWKYIGNKQNKVVKASFSNSLHGSPIPDSICVDAACSGNPGVLEYQGVDTKSGARLFHIGPFPEGTVNLGEFLGIVHALAYLKQRDSDWPVYTDSVTAMAWVRNKAIKTNLVRSQKNAGLFELVDRALNWVRENHWPNKILKWNTAVWGKFLRISEENRACYTARAGGDRTSF